MNTQKEIISSKDLQTAINGLSQVINNYCKHEGVKDLITKLRKAIHEYSKENNIK